MTNVKKFASLAVAATMAVASLVQPALAQGDLVDAGDFGLDSIRKEAGFGKKSIYETVGSIIKVILTLVGIIAIVLVIYGGFRWMTAAGSEEKVEDAKKILYSGVIGIVIIFSAYALTTFVLGTLLKATGTEGFSGL